MNSIGSLRLEPESLARSRSPLVLRLVMCLVYTYSAASSPWVLNSRKRTRTFLERSAGLSWVWVIWISEWLPR